MIVFKFSQTCIKIFPNFLGFLTCAYIFLRFSGCWVISNFVIFHEINVAKHIYDPFCDLVTEASSCFVLIIWICSILITIKLNTQLSIVYICLSVGSCLPSLCIYFYVLHTDGDQNFYFNYNLCTFEMSIWSISLYLKNTISNLVYCTYEYNAQFNFTMILDGKKEFLRQITIIVRWQFFIIIFFEKSAFCTR